MPPDNDRDGVCLHVVYAEPKDVEKAQDICNKLNLAAEGNKYRNYLGSKPRVSPGIPVLQFSLN